MNIQLAENSALQRRELQKSSQVTAFIEQMVKSLIRQETAKLPSPQTLPSGLDEALYNSTAGFKILLSSVSMHLDDAWRRKLNSQIDSLLALDEWDEADMPPTANSIRTFVRTLLTLGARRRPGMGATSNGNLIATWTVGENRLTVECQKDDEIRYSLVRNTGHIDRVAGVTHLTRLIEVLAPFHPEIWFNNAV